MNDAKRIVISGRGIPLRGNDIDTDRIIPARFLKTVVFDGLGEHAFEDDRKALSEAGKTHPFDDSRFSDAEVLVVNKNFGCGSSREHAPQAILRWNKGIHAVVGESFAEIFHGNCVALGIPCAVVDEKTAVALAARVEAEPQATVRVDLATKTVSIGDDSYPFTMPDGPRQQFMEGTWDSTAELLAAKDAVRKIASTIPYFRNYA
ncbi:MAG TPA: 3-isopropylmalate dehydratase small subunit [Polyangiaceae bacterium]|jgi:3-isopropylmalate/(R)-2-methylmalate dehydratase small subunit|nr:3-isopropylmalate dehydratase small subunit [Polyangiaceae bacterium]